MRCRSKDSDNDDDDNNARGAHGACCVYDPFKIYKTHGLTAFQRRGGSARQSLSLSLLEIAKSHTRIAPPCERCVCVRKRTHGQVNVVLSECVNKYCRRLIHSRNRCAFAREYASRAMISYRFCATTTKNHTHAVVRAHTMPDGKVESFTSFAVTVSADTADS